AQGLLADYQRKQRDALQEAEAMLRAAEEEAARLRARAEEDLAASLKRREQQALDRIAQAEAAAQAEVRNTAIDLAVSATRKLLEDRLDEKKAAGLVDRAIDELPGKLH
ncbi:MAG: F0F1 ATP synthase subunit B, partial [Rhodospirillaceae bacterium]|nr:F0F1 ATP synthase subunit B [Rhodospirillaceae bacterium]